LSNAPPPRSLVCLCDLRLFFFDRSRGGLKQSFSCLVKAERLIGCKQPIDVFAIAFVRIKPAVSFRFRSR
jgi:hypothetical protein